MKRFLLLIVAFNCLYISRNFSLAQEKIAKYPQDYFRNPLDIPIFLAGNFGECRPGHFHSGLDIKTEGRENLPVHAAAAGYVSRMRIQKGGFGHALYITHPNGFTTLYAHLNDFNPQLQKFLREKQYEKESWTVDILLKPDQFPVKKGEQIAWSGNTGGSTAPHLHFEIRDTQTEHPLNGLLFGLPIKDTQPPLPTHVAIYDAEQHFYEQTPRYYKLVKKGTTYTVPETILFEGEKAGVSVAVNDFMNGSKNTLNFYEAKWWLDDSLQGKITLDDIGYDVTRYVNAYADYKTKKLKNDWYQCLFVLPGNHLQIYDRMNATNGFLSLSEGTHQVKIMFADAFENSAIIQLDIKVAPPTLSKTPCNKTIAYKQSTTLQPYSNLKIVMDNQVLYDDVCADIKKTTTEADYSARYEVLKNYIPAHEKFILQLKPDKPIPFLQRDKIVMMYDDGKELSGMAAKKEGNYYTATVRQFGTYFLQVDSVPPTIQSLQTTKELATASSIRLSVKDAMTSVKEFRATLDGKWILFEPFGSVYVYKFDEHCDKGKHKLVVKAKDENDNEQVTVIEFER